MRNRAPRFNTGKSFVGLILFAFIFTGCSSTGADEDFPKKTVQIFEACDWDFDTLEPSNLNDIQDPNVHNRYYLLEEQVDIVWNSYVHSNPSVQWNGPIANLAAIYDPDTSTLYTPGNSECPAYSEGQVFFLDLVIEFMKHIPTAFMITEVNEENYTFAFNYLESNASRGMQKISFHELDSGGRYQTLVRHTSWFKSDSQFRDRLYTGYHEKALDEFHYDLARDFDIKIKVISDRNLQKKGLIPEDEPDNSI